MAQKKFLESAKPAFSVTAPNVWNSLLIDIGLALYKFIYLLTYLHSQH